MTWAFLVLAVLAVLALMSIAGSVGLVKRYLMALNAGSDRIATALEKMDLRESEQYMDELDRRSRRG